GVVDEALADRKAVYFPRVFKSGLEFLEATPENLAPGSYGVPEPRGGPVLDPSACAVLFVVPGLAFDPAGTRLGRGGGHYDRALPTYPRGLRVALAAEAQLSPDLPGEAWDQPVDAVATERRLLWSSARPGSGSKENPT